MQSSRDRYPLVVVASPSNGELTTCPIYPCASSRGSAVHAAKCLPKVSKPAFTWQSASLLGNSSNLNLNHILHGLRQSCCPLYRSQIIHSRGPAIIPTFKKMITWTSMISRKVNQSSPVQEKPLLRLMISCGGYA